LTREWCQIPDGFSAEFVKRNREAWREGLLSDLISACVLPRSATVPLVHFEDREPWWRGGTETYCCTFVISDEDQPTLEIGTRHVICKAAITLGGNLASRAEEWFARAERLHAYGASTGSFGASRGCLFQTFIHDSLVDVLRRAEYDEDWLRVTHLGALLGQLLPRIECAGFAPISLIDDLRFAEDTIYLVDLGSDLGAFSKTSNGNVYGLAMAELKRINLGARARNLVRDAVASSYEDATRSGPS
jgi:hypothetical protein